jgi:hypothetical protein
MFPDAIQAGEDLVLSLSHLASSSAAASKQPSTELVRVVRLLDAWRAQVEQKLTETLGDDLRSRFSYLFHVFRDELHAAGHTIGERDVDSLKVVVNLLRQFELRFDPVSRSQRFDWRQPITPTSPTPEPAEIEA